ALFGNAGIPDDIAAFLEPSSSSLAWNFEEAAQLLLQRIRKCASVLATASVEVTGSGLFELTRACLLAEQDATQQLARTILETGEDIATSIRKVQEDTRDRVLRELQWLEKEKVRRAQPQNKGIKPH